MFKNHPLVLTRLIITSPQIERLMFRYSDIHVESFKLTMDTQLPAIVPGRRHTLTPAAGPLGRFRRTTQDWIEERIARASRYGDPVVYEAAQFPWTAALKAGWRDARRELDSLLTDVADLPNFQDILEEVRTIQRDDAWKTFWLAGVGMDCSDNRRRCPATTRLLANVPGLRTAFFSILAPGKHVPAHRGAYNGVLRLHLALCVPEPADACRIRIADQILHWREGDILVFDDTFQHEVWNDTGGYRAVLFVDFLRPLRPPWNVINRLIVGAGLFAPFLRRAAARHRRWIRRHL